MENIRLNCFAMSAEEKERRMRLVDRACSAYYVILGSMFNTTNSWMVDAVELMKRDKSVWQGQARHGACASLHCFKDWEKRMRHTLGDRFCLWLDVTDKADEMIRPHVRNLYWAFDGVLLKERVENHGLKAMVETVRVLTDLCVLTFDKYFDAMEARAGVKFRQMFARSYFTGCRTWWDDVCDAVMRRGNGEGVINFNDHESCNLAFKVLERKMLDEDMYNLAGEYGIKENGELCGKYIDQNEKQGL